MILHWWLRIPCWTHDEQACTVDKGVQSAGAVPVVNLKSKSKSNDVFFDQPTLGISGENHRNSFEFSSCSCAHHLLLQRQPRRRNAVRNRCQARPRGRGETRYSTWHSTSSGNWNWRSLPLRGTCRWLERRTTNLSSIVMVAKEWAPEYLCFLTTWVPYKL